MGTVHYAATEKHDGTCPLCGMALVQSDQEAEAH
jgi:transcription initiation factor IIE alpha subunit